MTKEEIFALAEKADLYLASDDSVIKFAKLVAEHEREACAKICSEFPDVGYVKAILTCDYHSYLINKRGQE